MNTLDSVNTAVGSEDDGRTIEVLRSENDSLRDSINSMEKHNLDHEKVVKDLSAEIEDLKAKIKLLMEPNVDARAVVTEAEIQKIRSHLRRHERKPDAGKGAAVVSENTATESRRRRGGRRRGRGSGSRGGEMADANSTQTPQLTKERADGHEKRPAQKDSSGVQVDRGQNLRDELRNAKSIEAVQKAVERAKALNLKHEQELGARLLSSMTKE